MNHQNPHPHKDLTQELLDKSKEFLDKKAHLLLDAAIKLNQTSIHGLVNSYSARIDALILNTEKQENINYIAGHAILKLVSDTQMQLEFDLYFQNINGQWLNKKTASDTMNVHDYLEDESAAKLLNEKQIQFDIDKPAAK
ncbi:hypothetical protein [Moraxella marmotae]|uniref:hypothetical protein n=1 Tax=Moraxella marmotae TaxID=3344520 RepID=UPI0035F33EBF